ncbi:MAG: hypothetical protein LC789_09045 [Actinobacteria bacterium]|nr:hypothetical protein [Actinomycetota bacterium]
MSGPAGVPTGGCPFWEVHPDSTTAGLPYDYRGTIDTDHGSVGGGDCDISITPQDKAYDRVSVTSLSLANLTSNITDDGGRSFQPVANPVSQQIFAVDRQWQASDPTLGRHYLTVHDLATNNVQVSVSTDGYEYVQNTPAIRPELYPGARTNHFGALAVNPKTHKLYVPFLAPAGGSGEHGVYVAIGDPCAVSCTVGQPAGPIAWTNVLVYTAPSGTRLSHIFPALALDSAGAVYLAWTGDTKKAPTGTLDFAGNGIFVSHSSDGLAWSPPIPIADPTTHSNMFPWLVAGAPGQVGVAWYDGRLSPTATDCTGRTGGPNDNLRVNNNCLNDWRVTWAQSSDGGASFARTELPEVIHRGSVCDSGTTCATQMPPGDRTLLDFFDVALDPQGRPNIAFVSDTRAPGTADIHYTRLCSGTTLLGTDLPGPCAPLGQPAAPCPPDAAYTDPVGDAVNVLGIPLLPVSDPRYDITDGRLSTEPDGVRFTTHIPKLDSSGPGTIVETHFSARGRGFYVSAQRATATGAMTFVYGTSSAVTYRTKVGDTTGTFDDKTGIVTILFPRTALGDTTPLADGDVIASGADTTTRRDGVRVIPDADVAVDPCGYTVGAAAATTPGGTASATPTATVSATPTASVTPTASASSGTVTTPGGGSESPSPTAAAGGNGGNGGNGASSSASSSPSPSGSSDGSSASGSASPTEAAAPADACAGTGSNLPVRVNTRTVNATGLASVTVMGARPGTRVELQGYSQNHYGTASFNNDTTPVDRVAVADDNGAVTFDDLRPASSTRLRARQAGCVFASSATGVVISVRATETLQVERIGAGRFRISGTSIPARPGGLIVSLYRIVGPSCAAGVRPSDCPGERFLTQVRAAGEGAAGAGRYALTVTLPQRDRGTRVQLVVKTGTDAQNAPGRSNVRSLLVT